MLGSLSEGKRRWGCGKAVGTGCLVLVVILSVVFVLFLRWLIAPGQVPPAEPFVTKECKGFLIIRVRPEDKGVQAFLDDREKRYQDKLKKGETSRPPWLFRKVFGETPSQMLRRFMPEQMVWTVERGKDNKLNEISLFSLSRGRGWFSGMRRAAVSSADAVETAGEYKDKQILMLKKLDPEEKPGGKPKEKPEGKAAPEESTQEPKAATLAPGSSLGLFGLQEGGPDHAWFCIFDTTHMSASTFDALKKAIDIVSDPDATFQGKGYIKTAYDGFNTDMEVIGALEGEEKTAETVLIHLLGKLTREGLDDLKERLHFPGIQKLSGCADLVDADRVHVRFEAICADEKGAQAVHSTLAAELSALTEKKSIETPAHAADGPKVTVEFDVTDLDDLPRGERERREEARKKLEEAKKKKKADDGNADGNH